MEKRTVLVTGASSGIGKECALLLAEHGFHVFAGVRKTTDGAALVEATTGLLDPLTIDVTDRSTIRAAADSIATALGDDESFSLVNNAGIAVVGPLELLSIDDLRKQFEVNVFGHVAVTQAFLPLLRTHKGRIVFMGSLLGRISVPYLSPYAAAKFALEAISDAFAMELHKWGIRVSLLEPGIISTPIWNKWKRPVIDPEKGGASDEQELYSDAFVGMQRFGDWLSRSGIQPLRVARVVLRALTVRHPRPRYLIGWYANVMAKIAALGGDRARYWVFRRITVPR